MIDCTHVHCYMKQGQGSKRPRKQATARAPGRGMARVGAAG